MFDNGAVMSFGGGAGTGLQNSILASCRNQVAPQALGNKNRRATYDSGLSEQQFESSIAQLWNNSPSFNSVEDIWKFSPANGTAEVAGSQTSSSSPDEQHDAIFSLASQLTFNTNGFDEYGARPQPPAANPFGNGAAAKANRQPPAGERVKDSLCLNFAFQQQCELGDECFLAHSIMELGKPVKTPTRRTASNTSMGLGGDPAVSSSSLWFNNNNGPTADQMASMEFGRMM